MQHVLDNVDPFVAFIVGVVTGLIIGVIWCVNDIFKEK